MSQIWFGFSKRRSNVAKPKETLLAAFVVAETAHRIRQQTFRNLVLPQISCVNDPRQESDVGSLARLRVALHEAPKCLDCGRKYIKKRLEWKSFGRDWTLGWKLFNLPSNTVAGALASGIFGTEAPAAKAWEMVTDTFRSQA